MMQKIKNKENGFTLIEVLVSINLSFILITLLVSLYLFTAKFISLTIKRMDSKIEITALLTRTSNLLEKADSFYFEQLDSSAVLILNNKDTVYFEPKNIRINSLTDFYKIDDYELSFYSKTGEETKLINGIMQNTGMMITGDLRFQSYSIKNINLKLIKDSKQYNMFYTIPKYSINNYRNIGKDND